MQCLRRCSLLGPCLTHLTQGLTLHHPMLGLRRHSPHAHPDLHAPLQAMPVVSGFYRMQLKEGSLLLFRWLKFCLLPLTLLCSFPGPVLGQRGQLHPMTPSREMGGMDVGATKGRTLSPVAPPARLCPRR